MTTPTTQDALRDAHRDHAATPFTLTPGERLVVPCFCQPVGFYEVPVVLLSRTGQHRIVKLPDGSIVGFAADATMERVSAAQWARVLWRYSAVRAALTAEEGAS